MIGVCFRNESGFPSLVSLWMENGDATKYLGDRQNRENLDFINFVRVNVLPVTFFNEGFMLGLKCSGRYCVHA